MVNWGGRFPVGSIPLARRMRSSRDRSPRDRSPARSRRSHAERGRRLVAGSVPALRQGHPTRPRDAVRFTRAEARPDDTTRNANRWTTTPEAGAAARCCEENVGLCCSSRELGDEEHQSLPGRPRGFTALRGAPSPSRGASCRPASGGAPRPRARCGESCSRRAGPGRSRGSPAP